jgi:hypothetical protein
VQGSAYVDGSVESEAPCWLLRALKGRQWIDLAGGSMASRPLAIAAAGALNGLEPDEWDRFIVRELKGWLAGGWG